MWRTHSCVPCRHSWRHVLFGFLLPATFIVVGFGQQPLPPSPTTEPHYSAKFDGRWWTHAPASEQEGYTDGYFDCFIYDLKHLSTAKGWSTKEYVQEVEAFYTKHPSQKRESVVAVLGKINAAARPHPVFKGGEVWKEPHAYYDGLWWRGGDDEHRMGYVEGHLSCYVDSVLRNGGAFPKPALEYRSLIDLYIESHPNGDNEKVANILHRFQDRLKPDK